MFPKTNKQINQMHYKFGLKFLQKQMEISLDRAKCVGCGTCALVCPKDAIVSGPKTKGKNENLHSVMDDRIVLDVSDPKKCVYCGTCVYFCPFDALRMTMDGRVVPKDEIDIVTREVVPKLEGKMQIMKNAKEAHVYLKGNVEILKTENSNERDFQLEYVNNCPGECHKCVDICPNGALECMPFEEAVKTGITIKVDDKSCIACGSCVMACPSDKIKIKRTKIETSGPYSVMFMERICDKLGVPLPPNPPKIKSK
jgi:4Fe-4S ferredoxin